MNSLTMSYLVQTFAFLFSVGAAIFFWKWFQQGNFPMMLLNALLFVVNVGLFFFQFQIRSLL